MMRLSSAISLLVAVTFGLAAVILARGLVQRGVAAGPTVGQIVVAAKPIPFGTMLTSDNLREIPWTGDAPLGGAFASIAELTKDGRRLALVPLQRNEAILTVKVTAPNQRATLSTQIEDGMRAVSVRVDEVRGVAGFVLPGDRVDVILTRGETGAQEVAAAYADVLLQNTKVLAVDQSANERPDKPIVARAVTLELSVQQAQSVILAQGIGRLSLVLRQNGATDEPPSERVTASDIGTAGNGTIPQQRLGELERLIGELKKSSDQANANVASSSKKIAEMEAGLRDEIERILTAPKPVQQVVISQPPPKRLDVVVNVIRNAAKREQYMIVTDR